LFRQDFDIYYSNEWPIFHSICSRPVASPLIQEWCEVWTKPSYVMVMQKLLKKLCDYHVAVSEFTRRRLISLLKIDPKKVTVIPNGVDRSKFFGSSSKKVYGRIIYVGRLAPHKHVELLIDAFRIVKEKVPEAELHIVGSGPCLTALKNVTRSIKGCFIHGFLPDDQMINLLKSSWLFVLPSEREGSGIALLEGMAAGLPFVTVNYPDNASKELARYKCGVAVDPNIYSVSSAILQLLRDETLWNEMSNNALTFAMNYDWDVIAIQMENVMFRVLRNARR
jgi:glycosyltransferase involved in cell wall biosynthesis